MLICLEMMTYPVLTRCQQYALLSAGNQLRIRDPQRTTRRVLTPDEQYEWITNTFGLHQEVLVKALAVV